MAGRDLFIGLMSGTSLDGVDGVLARWPGDDAPEVLAFEHAPIDPALHAGLLALQQPGHDELHRSALAASALARAYAAVVSALLRTADVGPAAVRALGAHGQTVRHRPREFDGTGYTVQVLNGALLAELSGIDVVCDLRNRDVAAGGQGAPLVPAFHRGVFARPGEDVAVLNVGGIANLTLLRADGSIGGFDCGPGNVLMDDWCWRHLGEPYDRDGAWAAGGRVHERLLARWLAEPYFDRAPPKSTGRDLFDARWLDAGLSGHAVPSAADPTPAPRDVMATLCELTAAAAAGALQRHAPATVRLIVCGGGAYNGQLLRRLGALLGPRVLVQRSDAVGVPPDRVEALAFAWLAREFVGRRPGNLPAVTGAAGPRVLGALHPAGEPPA
ncbi:MAG: anhydro-N-acetylmuramic acid kinase [Pseudomonadota bacterium]